MAKIYGEIASSALMTFDKSFSRSNGQPLDSTEIFYSLAAAEAYAATDVAYAGQKIVVIETVDEVTTITHYGIEADNSLKELGAMPVGDGVTVEVVDGKIKLAGLEGKESGTYQPFLVDGEIEWRVPSAVTVEGLDARMETAEGDIDALEAVVGDEESGLVKAVADNAAAITAEITAREDGDKANADAIKEVQDAIGEIAEGKNVVEMIEDSVYDDSELSGRIDGVEEDITGINDKIGEVAEGKTVVGMIADAQEAATYDDTELAGRVSTAEGEIDQLQIDVAAAATAAALEAEIARAKAAEEKNAGDIALILDNPDTEVIDSIKEFTQYIADHGEVAVGLQTQITENKDAIATEKSRAEGIEAGLQSAIDTKAAQADLEAAVGRVAANEGEITTLKGLVGTTKVEDQIAAAVADKAKQADLDAAEELIAANAGEISTLKGLVGSTKVEEQIAAAIAGKVDKVEGKELSSNDFTDSLLAKLEGIAEGAQVNVIESVDEAQFALDADKKLTLLDIAIGKVTGLQDALDGKADKGTTLAAYGITDAYTKTETESRLQEVLDGLSDTSETAASVAQDLKTYKTSNDGRVDTIEGKLKDIADGAQVNVIESVSVAGTLLSIVDKGVNIPLGAGMKASDEITVAEDGTLGVGEININKIVQGEEEVLVLNGGTSVV